MSPGCPPVQVYPIFGRRDQGKAHAVLPRDGSAAEVEQAALLLCHDPSRAKPEVAAAAASDSKATMPPAPAPRGSVAPTPDALRGLFGEGSGGSGGVLRQLLMRALEALDAATALGGGQPDSTGQQLPLVISPGLDFGTVAVSRLGGEQLVRAAASVAAGLPAAGSGGNSSAAAAAAAAPHAGSLLDLLHLATEQQQSRPQQAGGGVTAAALPALPALHFRQLLIENNSRHDSLWLLGGVAAPALPHTLAAMDDGRLFWLDGGRGAGGVAWGAKCLRMLSLLWPCFLHSN